MRDIDIDLQGHLAISTKTKLHSTLFLYIDLGKPRGATRPKRAFVLNILPAISQEPVI